VANHLKHGMMTVRPVNAVAGAPAHAARASVSKAHGARYGMGGAPNGKPSMSMRAGCPAASAGDGGTVVPGARQA